MSFVKMGIGGFRKVQEEATIEKRVELQKARDGIRRTAGNLALELQKVAKMAPAKRQRVMRVVSKALHQMVDAVSRPNANMTKALINVINITKGGK